MQVRREIASIAYLVMGVASCALGLKSFLVPNHFIDGGVTGLSMLVAELMHWPLPLLLVLVNAPFLWFAYGQLGKNFTVRTGLAIAGLALVLLFVPFVEATQDKLLGAVFGGIFIGAGVGLAIRGGGVLDGTEILAVILGRKTAATVGEVILLLNVVIFSFAAWVFGIEPALYSVLTYLAAAQTIEYILHGIEAYNGVQIVSTQHEAIRQSLLTQLGRGVTAFRAQGGYSEADLVVLFCVVTRLEITRLKTIVNDHDPAAFLVVSPIHETEGGMVKRRCYHD